MHVHVSLLILHGTPIVCMAAWGYIANMHLESIVQGMLYILYILLAVFIYMQYVHTYVHAYVCIETVARFYVSCMMFACCSTTYIFMYVKKKCP